MWHLWQDRQHISCWLLCPFHAVAPVEKPGGEGEQCRALVLWFTGTWYHTAPELCSGVMVLFVFLGVTCGACFELFHGVINVGKGF